MAELHESVMIDIKDTISIFDKVGDGKLDISNIINALRSLDLNPAASEWENTINDFKQSGVSRIDIEQFAVIYDEERNKKAVGYTELSQGLKAIDPVSGELGLVNRAALSRYLTLLGDTITVDEAELILSSCADKSGKNVVIDTIVKTVMGTL